MSFRVTSIIALLLILCESLAAQEQTMPVDEIKPGMRGYGKTVFSGTAIEEFEFEVLEIIPNFRAKRDLILVKLIGEKVEHTGVVAGMSGSPMYIDGKLVGALAYRMGVFLKEPVAGITPIAQMLEILQREKVRDQELVYKTGFNDTFWSVAMGLEEFTWEKLIPPEFQKLQTNAFAPNISHLQVPLYFSGFTPTGIKQASEIFGNSGFEVVNFAGTFSASEDEPRPLEPGSAVAVVLVDGDFGLQGTGTVTYRDGDRVIGFGHPFLDFGAVSLPMARAKILTTLSSMMASTKMSAVAGVAGTLHQDRTTGIMGVSGETPRMIPVHLSFQSNLMEETEFDFRLAEDRSLYSFTPLIFSMVLANAIESARLSAGSQTLVLDGQIKMLGRDPIELSNVYATNAFLATDAGMAIGEIAATLGSLLSNSFETPSIEQILLRFEAGHKGASATVQRIDVDRIIVRPGEKLRVVVHLKEYQGKVHKTEHTLSIPDNFTSSSLVLYAGSGGRLTQLEARSTPQRFRPQTFDQLVKLLESRRKNNQVFFQLRQRDNGMLIEGDELPALPPSVLSVMNSQKSQGTVVSLRDRVIAEEYKEVDFAVTGGETVRLRVESKAE